MQLRKNTLLVVFLLLQCIALVCSTMRKQRDLHDYDGNHLPCVTQMKSVTCKLAEAHLKGFQMISLNISAGKTVQIHTESSESACLWKQRGTTNLVQLQYFERNMDGVYTAVCGNNLVNISVSVHSPANKPLVPKLTVIQSKSSSVDFKCVSEGNPKPTIEWYQNEKLISSVPQVIKDTPEEMTESKLSSTAIEDSNIKCCAKNPHGEECSYIYYYSLLEPGKIMQKTEAPLILLCPGQSLLLRCKFLSNDKNCLHWYFNDTKLPGIETSHYSAKMIYYNDLVTVQHSGEYTCQSNTGKTKTTRVQVLKDDLLEVLNVTGDVRNMAKEVKNVCFQVQVFSYPRAQCNWIIPNGTNLQCDETEYLWGKSTFKLCNPEPGQYQVRLRAGNKTTTRTMSACVTGFAKFVLLQDLANVTCRTSSTIPLKFTWMTCPSADVITAFDCSVWKETPMLMDPRHYPDSEQFCHKNIVISRPLSELSDHFVKCCLENEAGVYCSEGIHVKMPSKGSLALVVTIGVLFSALMMAIFALFYFVFKKKPGYEPQLQMIQMVGSSDNDYIYIDFRDFKYDPEWDFPRENLELGKELGSGAFGMVVQATAYGICKPGASLQVAVKMLKEKHQAVEKEALMSELKMLTHIGHHTNIVNLLGACTGPGPIYLIFQFCHYGDLLNYLKNNREHFYKSLTDAFNKDRFSNLYQNYQKKGNSSELVLCDEHNYVPMFPVKKEQEALLSSNSLNINNKIFEDEGEADIQTLTYDELLSFSYQVAKGMEFLSSKNCIHRDLAARNVLVTEGRLVKIGDFGLARDIENDSNYVVRGNARLPVKWMAPESIFSGMCTMQSDVWAYGILLWEIFSLGVTPYPGVKVDNTFYAMIKQGFQMEQPYYASKTLYKVMCQCWALQPQSRPCFSKLVTFMEDQLNDVEKQLYLNVGEKQKSDSMYLNAPVNNEEAGKVEKDEKEKKEETESDLSSTCTSSHTMEPLL